MRKLLVITAFLLFAGIAFGQTSKTTQVDFETEKAALNELLDKMDSAIKAQDVSTMASFLSEDLLCCGTDPSEFWNKQQITDLWTQMLDNTTFEIKYIGDREIKVVPDGNSAIVVTQYFVPIYSPKIPWRSIYYFVKTNDNWMIHFMSSAFIPKNEDISKLNEALD
jgi:ketosteroid isomerase-like protein